MQKSKLKKSLFYVFIYAGIGLELMLVIPYQVKKFNYLHSQIKDIKGKLSQLDKEKTEKDTILNEIEILKEEGVNVEKRIITFSDISTISAYISTKAKESSVDILEIFPSDPQPYKTIQEGNFLYLPIKIEAKTGYHNLAQFINILEQGDYFLDTKELVIKQDNPYHRISMVIVALLKE